MRLKPQGNDTVRFLFLPYSLLLLMLCTQGRYYPSHKLTLSALLLSFPLFVLLFAFHTTSCCVVLVPFKHWRQKVSSAFPFSVKKKHTILSFMFSKAGLPHNLFHSAGLESHHNEMIQLPRLEGRSAKWKQTGPSLGDIVCSRKGKPWKDRT